MWKTKKIKAFYKWDYGGAFRKVHIVSSESCVLNMRKECCKTLLLSEVSSWLQQRNTSLEAHRRTCRGGRRIVGLITSGQVLDCCPPAVLFYPIRNSICCPTQLLSGHTSHPHRWEHCVCVCGYVCECVCLCCCFLHKQHKHSGEW